ncbi:MAG: glutamate racemase [Myxococcota bacterium]
MWSLSRAAGAKAVVIACNTASAVALPDLEENLAVPTLGVIAPGALLATQTSRSGRIGVIGTAGTIASGRYQEIIRSHAPLPQVFVQACPLLVPLVEEGLLDHRATRLIAEEYLAPLKEHHIDALVLGCTHYPLLKPLLAEICGAHITLIDSATAVAQSVADLLGEQDLLSTHTTHADRFFATDRGGRFESIGQSDLGEALQNLEWDDL